MQKEEGTTRKRSKYKTWLIIPDEELFRAMVKPKTGEPWTKTEDAILRKNFWLPFEELKVLLPGRSKGAITKRMYVLHLKGRDREFSAA